MGMLGWVVGAALLDEWERREEQEHYHAMRYCNMKSLCDRFVAEDEQGIEAEVVAAKDTKTSAATSFDAAAGLAALTKHGIGLVTAHTLPNRRMVRKGGAGLQIRCVIGK